MIPKHLFISTALLVAVCQQAVRLKAQPTTPEHNFDIIIHDGQIYDGNGGPPFTADIGISGDLITAIDDLSDANAKQSISARGMAVAPGFINVLSWATASLLEDGRAMSDIRQGVTLEIFGEGWSMGPLNKTMKADLARDQ